MNPEAARQAAGLALMMIRNLESDADAGGDLRADIAEIPNGLTALCLGYEMVISLLLTVLVADGRQGSRPAAVDALANHMTQLLGGEKFKTDMAFLELVEDFDRVDGEDEDDKPEHLNN